MNVGAGTGSYEPSSREVVAVEPSTVMIAQRPQGAAPAIRAVAESLPFGTKAFDAAMAISTLHHWKDWAAGIGELRRVSRRVVVVHFDPAVHDDFWLVRDYLPELSDVWRSTPTPHDVARILGPATQIESLMVPRDCRDGFLSAYWHRPSRYLDEETRRCMSGLQALDTDGGRTRHGGSARRPGVETLALCKMRDSSISRSSMAGGG